MKSNKTKEIQKNKNTDVHTRHCCRNCGCKYGEDDVCTVMCGIREQEYSCGHAYTCFWEELW